MTETVTSMVNVHYDSDCKPTKGEVREIRCSKCNRMLGKAVYPEDLSKYSPALEDSEGRAQKLIHGATYETKCPRCGEINIVKF